MINAVWQAARYCRHFALALSMIVALAPVLRAQGFKSLHGFDLVHPAAPASPISFRLPASFNDMSFILPLSAPTSNQVLVSGGANNPMQWSSSAAPALSSLTAAVASNTIDNSNFAQTWEWTGTVWARCWWINGATTYSQNTTAMKLSLTGANANASQTTTTLRLRNSYGGTRPRNIGLWVEGWEGSGWAGAPTIIVSNGLTGFRTTTPSAIVHLGPGTSTANSGAPLKLGVPSGAETRKAGDVCFASTEVAISNVADDMAGVMPSKMFRCLNEESEYIATNLSWNNVFNTTTNLPTFTLDSGLYRFEAIIGMTYDNDYGFGFNVLTGTVETLWMTVSGQAANNINNHKSTCNTALTNTAILTNATGTISCFFVRGILKVTTGTADLTPRFYARVSNNSTNSWKNNTVKITKIGVPNLNNNYQVGKWD